jgi:small-conductance mechanosensitive channel
MRGIVPTPDGNKNRKVITIMREIYDYSIFGNTVLAYLTSIGIFLGGMLAIYVFRKYILSRMKRLAEMTSTRIDDLVVMAIEKGVLPFLYVGIFYGALHTLVLAPEFHNAVKTTTMVVLTILAVRTGIAALNYLIQSSWQDTSGTSGGEKQLKGIRGLVNFVIWGLALVFLLDNLGVKISAVVTGLGIGGVAVALAAQAVLGDLFSYFVIFFDKPFEIGDFIIVDEKMGAVEYIGIKTTRLRALGGEQLIFANKDLTNSRVHNYKKMEKRRVVFKLGVVYQTTAEALKRIPGMVRDIIVAQHDVTFDRGHFSAFGDSSLDFEFVYYVTGSDYTKYMDIQQAINFGVFESFARESIEMAYPTQTLYLNKAA